MDFILTKQIVLCAEIFYKTNSRRSDHRQNLGCLKPNLKVPKYFY